MHMKMMLQRWTNDGTLDALLGPMSLQIFFLASEKNFKIHIRNKVGQQHSMKGQMVES